MKSFRILLSIILCSLCVSCGHENNTHIPSGITDDATPVLYRIASTGSFVMGYRSAAMPFSYVDAEGLPRGYTTDICYALIEAVRKELELPHLKIDYTPITAQNKLMFIENGIIDMDCGNTARLPHREERAKFTPPTFVVHIGALVKKSSHIKSLQELKNKTVVCSLGTSTCSYVQKYYEAQGWGSPVIVYGRDHADSLMMLQSGRAAVFFMDDMILSALQKTMPRSEDYLLLEERLPDVTEESAIPYSLYDPKFDEIIRKTFIDLLVSGQLEDLYNKWFMSPIPPVGLNLEIPISDQLSTIWSKIGNVSLSHKESSK